MSNLIFKQWTRYYQMPCLPENIERNIGLAAHRYYAFLWRRANEHSAGVLEFSNEQIGEATGIRASKTLAKARRELVAAGLITITRVPPGVFAHTLLSQSGEPIPPPKERKGIRRYECHHHPMKPAQIPQSLESERKSLGLPANNHQRCYVHGWVEHWQRNGDWVCSDCHPDPREPVALTAKDVGFD